ncbi:MAG: SDR family NAD(P)-dependent oxidoreductase [Chitinophagales bacterium]|nr:SDR family NAD(P)-dependent oxidoreductase [Chitinophagales bacterium]
MILTNKTAIVSGASSGLGAAIAKALVQQGTKVYGIARNLKNLQQISDILGDQFIPVSLDISEVQAVTNWIDNTFSATNLPDILINNAGIGYFRKIDEMNYNEWTEMIQTNLNGTFLLTSQIVPWMKKHEGIKHIINIGSIMGTIAQPESSGYSTTKFGIQGFSEALFKELRYDKIKVTCVNPGSIETDFFKNSNITTHSNMLQADDIASSIIHILQTPDNVLIDSITIRPLIPQVK